VDRVAGYSVKTKPLLKATSSHAEFVAFVLFGRVKMVFRLIRALKCALLKSGNQAARNKAAYAAYEVMEKSQELDQNAYRYKALIRVKDAVSSIDKTVVAAEIQRSMGYDPFAYLIYDVRGCACNGIIELTWKSWDSCD
jgi:hypothetical protein